MNYTKLVLHFGGNVNLRLFIQVQTDKGKMVDCMTMLLNETHYTLHRGKEYETNFTLRREC